MTGEQYLRQLGAVSRRLAELDDKISILNSRLSLKSPTGSEDSIQTSHAYDRIGDAMAELYDLSTEASNIYDQYKKLREDIHHQLMQMDDKDLAFMIWSVYVAENTVPQYAADHKMKKNTAYHKMKRALKEFEKVYKQNIVVRLDNPH